MRSQIDHRIRLVIKGNLSPRTKKSVMSDPWSAVVDQSLASCDSNWLFRFVEPRFDHHRPVDLRSGVAGCLDPIVAGCPDPIFAKYEQPKRWRTQMVTTIGSRDDLRLEDETINSWSLR
ncbi:hypothetical protein U1Q18_039545 [Sarracenia purpurea var. burkii]